MVKAIDHITINMAEKEKTFWFYGEVLGLEKLNDVDMGDHHLYYYQLPGSTRLELTEFNYDTSIAKYEYTNRGMYRHFALKVDDIHALYERLTANGIKVHEGPDPSDKLGVYYMLVQDPNGVEVEFVEPM